MLTLEANGAGVTVVTSTGAISQNDVAPLVNSGLYGRDEPQVPWPLLTNAPYDGAIVTVGTDVSAVASMVFRPSPVL